MTKEEVEQAFNGLSPYYAYKQGLQDGVAYNEESFRREAAKDILCAITANGMVGNDAHYKLMAQEAIKQADELIRQLKVEKKDRR